LLQNLKPGQILQGTAMSENVGGKLSLQIGVTRLIAQTQVSIRPGQALTLQVVKTDAMPELRVLTLPSLNELKAAALKTLLPRQQPLPQVFKALTQVMQTPVKADTSIPPAVRAEVSAILNQTPRVSDPQFRENIKAALSNSGLVTETKLLRQLTANPADMKLNLMRLYETVRQLLPEPLSQLLLSSGKPIPQIQQPGTNAVADNSVKLLIGLLKSLDGGIARIQTHQLNSLPQEDPLRQIWQFELPIRNGDEIDLFHFRIGRETNAKSDVDEHPWSLTLQMNLSTLGPMRVQIRLTGESVSTIIWSERSSTDTLVKEHIDRLRKGYEKAGLEVTRLESFIGIIETDPEISSDLSLLHEKV
jgi:hypothetical protein